MIWIIGGTADAVSFLKALEYTEDIIVTVATEYGRLLLSDYNVIVGRMNRTQMSEFISDHGIDLILNLSHPYADLVTQNAVSVSDEVGIEYHRFIREGTEHVGSLTVKDVAECMELLEKLSGVFLFTTGSKNIPDFEQVKGGNRFIYRILPMAESLEICERSGVIVDDIICMKGPFSKDLNRAFLRAYKADYMVMKDSGKSGGTDEKLSACIEESVMPIVIDRPKISGVAEFGELLWIIEKHRANCGF